jgi:hypothetical protein
MWQTAVGLMLVMLLHVNPGPLTSTRRSEPWLLRGSVVRVSNDVIEVRHKSGRLIRIGVDSTTIIEHEGAAVPGQVLAPRQRVSITVDTIGQMWRAGRVVIHSKVDRR